MLDQLVPIALRHNSVAAWGLAGAFLAVGVVASIVGRRLGLAWVERHPNPQQLLPRALAALVHSTWPIVPLALGVGAGSAVLDLPGSWSERVGIGARLFLILQVGLWGRTLVEFALDAWFDRHATVDAATRSGRGMLRFVGGTAVWTLAAMLGLKTLDISVSGLAAGLGVAGVAVTLATQSLVGDLFASLSILLDKPFLVGDTIAVGAITGRVERIGVRTTRVRNVSGEEVVVPNSDIVRARLHNFRTLAERRVVFGLNVRYDTPPKLLREAGEVIREAIEAQQGVAFDRAELMGFGDLGLRFEIVYFVKTPDYIAYTAAQQRINWAILDGFWRLGVGFAHLSPARAAAGGPSAA